MGGLALARKLSEASHPVNRVKEKYAPGTPDIPLDTLDELKNSTPEDRAELLNSLRVSGDRLMENPGSRNQQIYSSLPILPLLTEMPWKYPKMSREVLNRTAPYLKYAYKPALKEVAKLGFTKLIPPATKKLITKYRMPFLKNPVSYPAALLAINAALDVKNLVKNPVKYSKGVDDRISGKAYDRTDVNNRLVNVGTAAADALDPIAHPLQNFQALYQDLNDNDMYWSPKWSRGKWGAGLGNLPLFVKPHKLNRSNYLKENAKNMVRFYGSPVYEKNLGKGVAAVLNDKPAPVQATPEMRRKIDAENKAYVEQHNANVDKTMQERIANSRKWAAWQKHYERNGGKGYVNLQKINRFRNTGSY
jgi:hypothetical protein